MTVDEKLRAIRDVIQRDVGARGLTGELFGAFPDDFASACRSIAAEPYPILGVVTGFYIPNATPPCGETDGPLGAVFLARAARHIPGLMVLIATDPFAVEAIRAGLPPSQRHLVLPLPDEDDPDSYGGYFDFFLDVQMPTHLVALERVGPSASGRCHTMRGRDITEFMRPGHLLFEDNIEFPTIGIGDGGNEIGMGKLPRDVIERNIPNGATIACRVPCDHLIVAGVSNWGAYALAAGIAIVRGVELPRELFDIEQERAILQVMVEQGPLVDGVTGQPTVTVDGLPFEVYAEPLRRIGEIVAG